MKAKYIERKTEDVKLSSCTIRNGHIDTGLHVTELIHDDVIDDPAPPGAGDGRHVLYTTDLYWVLNQLAERSWCDTTRDRRARSYDLDKCPAQGRLKRQEQAFRRGIPKTQYVYEAARSNTETFHLGFEAAGHGDTIPLTPKDTARLTDFVDHNTPPPGVLRVLFRERYNDHVVVGGQAICEINSPITVEFPPPDTLVTAATPYFTRPGGWTEDTIARSVKYDNFCSICLDYLNSQRDLSIDTATADVYRCIECDAALTSHDVGPRRDSHLERCPNTGEGVTEGRADFRKWRVTGEARNTPLQSDITEY